MPQTDVKTQVAALAVESFETFCEDIAGIFRVDMKCDPQQCRVETVQGLAGRYNDLSALFAVQSTGALDGTFHLVIEREGVLTLAGIIVMLPEKGILNVCSKGTRKDAEELTDAIGETGNLLVGAWDCVFRESLSSHGHFSKTGTFIGNPWSDSQENLGLAADQEVIYIPVEITAGPYPAFSCGAIFPTSFFPENFEDQLFEETDSIPQEPAESPDQTIEELVTDDSDRVETPEDISVQTDEQTPEIDSADVEDEPEQAGSENVDSTDLQEQNEAGVSRSIQKMVHSSPALPGEPGQPFLSMCAKDIMQTSVLWGSGDDSVQQAMEKMQQADAGYLIVGADGQLEGLVSWVDLIGAVSIYLKPAFAKWRRPADEATLQIRIRNIMTRQILTARPDTPLAVIMQNMHEHGLHCLPVIGEQANVQGLITAFDIFKSLLNSHTGSIPEPLQESEQV